MLILNHKKCSFQPDYLDFCHYSQRYLHCGESYKQGLAQLGLETLSSRRETLCLNFALKCAKNPKLQHMFPLNEKNHNMETRKEEKYKVEFANTDRKKDSPIIYMQKLLNQNENNK